MVTSERKTKLDNVQNILIRLTAIVHIKTLIYMAVSVSF